MGESQSPPSAGHADMPKLWSWKLLNTNGPMTNFPLVVSGWNKMGISRKPVVLTLGRSVGDL